MTNPTPEERFSSYLTKLNTPKKGELRRVFSQIVGEIEQERDQLADELRKRTEDAERMAEALFMISRPSIVNVEAKEDGTRVATYYHERTFDTEIAERALSDLNFSYPPKP